MILDANGKPVDFLPLDPLEAQWAELERKLQEIDRKIALGILCAPGPLMLLDPKGHVVWSTENERERWP